MNAKTILLICAIVSFLLAAFAGFGWLIAAPIGVVLGLTALGGAFFAAAHLS